MLAVRNHITKTVFWGAVVGGRRAERDYLAGINQISGSKYELNSKGLETKIKASLNARHDCTHLQSQLSQDRSR